MSHLHAHTSGHADAHGHAHAQGPEPPGVLTRLQHRLRPHSHDAADKVDAAMEGSAEGIRVLWVSLGVLAATTVAQAAVVAASGSVALLGDTLHNAADALTAVPLGVAFILGRRTPTRRYTYGYGRAEDLAGVAIVMAIAASSALAAFEAISRLLHPHAVSHLIAVAVAALIGFAGNELVARYRISTGRKIGSAALVADGLHARTDGFTSLAVLIGAGGVALGWDWADPVVGLLITVAILAVLRQAGREIYRRLMDAVDPALLDQAEQTLRATPGVLGVGQVRLRWVGHRLRAECEVIVDPGGTVIQAHQAAVNAEHALLHALPRLTAALVHADPGRTGDTDHHAILTAHR
ncbi:MAG TPA: cation diffusion facilitator family transporter [Streptosporangiaceae bacterium]